MERASDIIDESFADCNLCSQVLRWHTVDRCDFSGAKLCSTQLIGHFYACDFSGADLRDADLSGATFADGCVFTGARYNVQHIPAIFPDDEPRAA